VSIDSLKNAYAKEGKHFSGKFLQDRTMQNIAACVEEYLKRPSHASEFGNEPFEDFLLFRDYQDDDELLNGLLSRYDGNATNILIKMVNILANKPALFSPNPYVHLLSAAIFMFLCDINDDYGAMDELMAVTGLDNLIAIVSAGKDDGASDKTIFSELFGTVARAIRFSPDTMDQSSEFDLDDLFEVKIWTDVLEWRHSMRPDFITIKDERYSTDLTEISLKQEQLTDTDIEPLRHMTNLTELSLYDNQISDISALSGLTNLTKLDLRANQISDISALFGLTNLNSLDLHDNPISDWSPVVHIDSVTGRPEQS
jgi:hypothetical protein